MLNRLFSAHVAALALLPLVARGGCCWNPITGQVSSWSSVDQTPRAEEFSPPSPTIGSPIDVQYAVQPRPSPYVAMLLFARPSADHPALKVILHDHLGRFLVESRASSYSAVLVDPGDYTLVAHSEDDSGVRATLRGGRVYYVQLSPSPGGRLPRANLVALHPGDPAWKEIRTWVRGAKQFTAERKLGQAAIDALMPDVTRRTQRVAEKLDHETGEMLRQHTLLPSDGK